MIRRPDSRPAPFERAVLEGRSPAANQPSPNYVLAAEVRGLNSKLARLDAEQQAEVQQDWLDAWDALTAERESAEDEAAELAAIEAWAGHWRKRLRRAGHNYQPGANRGWSYGGRK